MAPVWVRFRFAATALSVFLCYVGPVFLLIMDGRRIVVWNEDGSSTGYRFTSAELTIRTRGFGPNIDSDTPHPLAVYVLGLAAPPTFWAWHHWPVGRLPRGRRHFGYACVGAVAVVLVSVPYLIGRLEGVLCVLMGTGVIAGLIGLARLVGRWQTKEQRRLAKGLCPSCGYDLRATLERCPECGNVPPLPLERVVRNYGDRL